MRQELQRRHAMNTRFSWAHQARPSQRIPPGDWRIWLILAGRGFGKTRTGAETIRAWTATYKRMCLLGHTLEDVRQVMIEGVSGLLSVCSPEEGIHYAPAKRHVTWKNGAMAMAYSAESPQQLRGPQFDAAWIDELAKFTRPQEVWDQLMFGLRLGTFPRLIITTTPRPIPLLEHLIQRPDVVVTYGSTFENKENLPEPYLNDLLKTYMGTRLGSQEIEGKILAIGGDALWKSDYFVYTRAIPPLRRLVIAVDPAVTHHQDSDETGIIVAGCDGEGRGYVLEDLSGRYAPMEWVQRVVEAFRRHQADMVVAEVNNGGDMVEDLLRAIDGSLPFKAVHATRGKITRAEPVAALYEQRRILHARYFPELETQLLTYTRYSQTSPDRLDALVWALTELLLQGVTPAIPKIWDTS